MKFTAVSRISPDFYREHEHPIEFACAFLNVLASNYPTLNSAFRRSLPLSVKDAAPILEGAIRQTDLDEKEILWFDRQSTEALKALVPVTRDPRLPEWLAESRWAILGAFEDAE